jgi:hypothetical protein
LDRLFHTLQYVNSWIAQTVKEGWVRFPAKLDGWDDREPAKGIDSIRLREVPLAQGVNTGMPGTEYDADGLASHLHPKKPAPPEPAPRRPRIWGHEKALQAAPVAALPMDEEEEDWPPIAVIRPGRKTFTAGS